MSKAIINEQSLTDIADAIRAKNGSADTYTPAEMAAAIANLPSGGGTLPSDYQQVEYIASSGTQYIVFAYEPRLNDIWELDCQFTGNVAAGNYGINGGIYSGGGSSRRCAIGYYNGGFQASFGTTAQEFGVSDNNRHKFIIDSGDSAFYVDSTKYTMTNVDMSTLYSLAFFARVYTYQQKIEQKTSLKFYGSKITRGDTTLFDFVPCYNKDSGTIGLFELISQTFYTNAGTGTFTKGADV